MLNIVLYVPLSIQVWALDRKFPAGSQLVNNMLKILTMVFEYPLFDIAYKFKYHINVYPSHVVLR